jgi:hypothetical protein
MEQQQSPCGRCHWARQKERKYFEELHPSLEQDYGGTFDQLADYLGKAWRLPLLLRPEGRSLACHFANKGLGFLASFPPLP